MLIVLRAENCLDIDVVTIGRIAIFFLFFQFFILIFDYVKIVELTILPTN